MEEGSIQYDLISSPMRINDLFKKMHLPRIESGEKTESGSSRTTTPSKSSVSTRASESLSEATRLVETTVTHPDPVDQVSVYSGPLHNDRMNSAESQPTASLADRLANARMMQKSGYTWDPAGACAKIRLGDGAILQNLYPSHSHVKLRNGTVERIDAYCQRMMSDRELLKEITMIKSYEYNQWSRTRGLNVKDYENCKPVPIDKIESKSTQPSWNTVRPMNVSLINLGAKNRLFSYEDLASKFSQPKFLKRMGFIENETDYNPRQISSDASASSKTPSVQTDPADETETTSSGTKAKSPASNPELLADEIAGDDVMDDASEELSSDDEEYHQDQQAEEMLSFPPERVPSSKRSTRQRLALYKDDLIIGSKKSVAKDDDSTADKQEVLKCPDDKTTIALSTVKLVDELINQNQGPRFTALEAKSRSSSFQSKPIRRESLKVESVSKLHRVDKGFVRFSQPVCLCPKLSKETLNSFYSPTMQKCLSSHSNSFMRCQLHANSRYNRARDKIILKSL